MSLFRKPSDYLEVPLEAAQEAGGSREPDLSQLTTLRTAFAEAEHRLRIARIELSKYMAASETLKVKEQAAEEGALDDALVFGGPMLAERRQAINRLVADFERQIKTEASRVSKLEKEVEKETLHVEGELRAQVQRAIDQAAPVFAEAYRRNQQIVALYNQATSILKYQLSRPTDYAFRAPFVNTLSLEGPQGMSGYAEWLSVHGWNVPERLQ
ncbi:MAG TPA: hypothetical protein VFD98_09050 [Terracidiphilus sp.]|jgi:hypothetical protein|nr:hypothetical protein [Terracidiphilus sp.]